MSCRICGRSSCTECFHSIEEQQRYDELVEMYGEKGIWHSIDYYENLVELENES